jgi:mannose-6-phosphate isomerase-like protein (cupin superfamily)
MLLTGPPPTAGMVAGRVVLKPGEAMHRHSTENNEELLVVLHGRGQVVLGREPVAVAAGEVLYVPPRTEREVRNDGQEERRYIFTVAPVGR